MPAYSPEQLGHLFAEALNSARLQAIIALFEPNATLIHKPGQSVAGFRSLTESIAGLLSIAPHLEIRPKGCITSGNLSLIFTEYSLKGKSSDGAVVSRTGESVDIARQQRDTTWRFLVHCLYPPVSSAPTPTQNVEV